MTDEHAEVKQNVKAGNTDFIPDYKEAIVRPSPNFSDRRGSGEIYILIMHYTATYTAEMAEQWLTGPQSGVSAHYVVRKDGTVVQLVQESKRAWHAGAGFWQGERDINSHSIGIEIANDGSSDYARPQINGVIALSSDIIARNTMIKPRYVLGHSDVAPERKEDPGVKFPWKEMSEAGIGLYVPPASIYWPFTCLLGGRAIGLGDSGDSVKKFQSMLALCGYNITVNGKFDDQTEYVTKAFQRHFRPDKVSGRADRSTIRTLRRLLAKLQPSISIP